MKLIFVFLIFFLNVLLPQSIQAAEVERLQAAFNGDQPFFGVAVTRDVENNPSDYTPLSQEESYFIFCLLNSLYGKEVREDEFMREIEKIQTEKVRKYSFLREQEKERIRVESLKEVEHKIRTKPFLDKMIPRLNKSAAFKSFFVLEAVHAPVLQKIVEIILLIDNPIKLFEEVRKGLSGEELADESLRMTAIQICEMLEFLPSSPHKVTQAKKILEEIFTIKNSIRTLVEESFTENERFLLTSLEMYQANFPSFFEAQKIKLFQQYKEVLERQLRGLREQLGGLNKFWSLVVFNEMFFSKTMPLSFEQFFNIKNYFIDFSALNPKAILQANFLKERYVETTAQGKALRLNVESYYYREMAKKIPGFFYSSKVGDWGGYLEKIKQNGKDFLNIFNNINYTYWNRETLNFYEKSSYREEADTLLQKEHLYTVGMAKNLPLRVSGDASQIQHLIHENMSTEICYDLEMGVRKAFASYPRNLKVHVVPSNTLPITHRNIDNLPDNGSVIFHVDPEYTELLVKNKFQVDVREAKPESELFNKFKHHKFIRKSPLLSFQIMTDNNLYTFSFWLLDQAIKESM
ncbi:MAG: hypothetical protein K2W94_01065 [Alphaproteobacteria bacterium]|nr:hypothetical protein [Alphaproteobacteria bacterium]